MMPKGGTLFVDDTHLYSVAQLCLLLRQEAAFEYVAVDAKLATFRKLTQCALSARVAVASPTSSRTRSAHRRPPMSTLVRSSLECIESPDRPRIFGIGLNKTGTSSLHEALEILGYTGLHFAGPERAALIRRAIEEQQAAAPLPRPGLRRVLRHAGDHVFLARRRPVPGLEVHPHGARPGRVARQPPAPRREEPATGGGRRLRGQVPQSQSRPPGSTNTGSTRGRCAPTSPDRPDDLLVLDVTAGEGWEPLCDFLGAPVPDQPFPWENRYRPWREADSARPRALRWTRATASEVLLRQGDEDRRRHSAAADPRQLRA